jgi:hypothetical protein
MQATWVFMQVWQEVINLADEHHGNSIFLINGSAANTTPA